MLEKLNRMWCGAAHGAPMWPIHGRYECRNCGRSYAVDWDAAAGRAPAAPLVTWKLADASEQVS